jgi:hypothetical protein
MPARATKATAARAAKPVRKIDGRTVAGRKAAAARAANGAARGKPARAAAPETVRKPRRKAVAETPAEPIALEVAHKPRGRRKKIVEPAVMEPTPDEHGAEHDMPGDHEPS